MVTSKTPTRGALLRDRIGGGKSITLKNVLTGKDGIEVSIPNIIVAIVVSLVVIASVVAGVVFIIPWAQDASAQGDIQTVQAAEQIYYAQQAPAAYGTASDLVTTKAILASDKDVAIKANANEYCVATKSAHGNYYWLTSATTTIYGGPGKITPPVVGALTCPTVAQIGALITASTGISATSPVIP
jgi:hypothetical protein